MLDMGVASAMEQAGLKNFTSPCQRSRSICGISAILKLVSHFSIRWRAQTRTSGIRS